MDEEVVIARRRSPFNTPLETGVRALAILAAAFPRAHDLHRLVQYDYLTVHSADADGPPSLHAALPLRSGELLVRRGLVERGLQLMISRGLIARTAGPEGILYSADEWAGPFLDNLRSQYMLELRERADWVVDQFDSLTAENLDGLTKRLFEAWTTEFQPVQLSLSGDLLA
jgi:hypothetical protein